MTCAVQGFIKSLIDAKKPINGEISLIGETMKYKGIEIKKSPNGVSWFARFRKNGKQHYVSAKTQMECYNKVKNIYNDLTSKNTKTKTTFISWYKQWLEIYKKEVKETTKIDYKNSINYLKEIYDKEINKITTIELINILTNIQYERRRQKVYEILKDIFTKALNNDLIAKNPMVNIEKPKHKKINGNAFTNNDEEILEKLFLENNADIFLIALYQGLRKGEILAITRDDIDFENKTLTINKSLNNLNKIDTTKNKYSTRTIPIFNKTLNILEKYKNIKGRLFNISASQCQEQWRSLMRKVKNEKSYTIHSLRHTFITKCQEKNIPLHIIQHWCGHVTGSKVTNEVYTHTRKNAELLYYNIINE